MNNHDFLPLMKTGYGCHRWVIHSDKPNRARYTLYLAPFFRQESQRNCTESRAAAYVSVDLAVSTCWQSVEKCTRVLLPLTLRVGKLNQRPLSHIREEDKSCDRCFGPEHGAESFAAGCSEISETIQSGGTDLEDE